MTDPQFSTIFKAYRSCTLNDLFLSSDWANVAFPNWTYTDRLEQHEIVQKGETQGLPCWMLTFMVQKGKAQGFHCSTLT